MEILGLKAKKKPSNRRHDSESDVERQLLEAMMEIVGLKAKKKTSNRRHESKSDLKRQLLEARMEILGLKVLYFTHSNYSFSKFFFAFLFLLL
ncbi:PREDICTED: uncharacterized protein LOC18607162 isoform X3 [Theobroma cacao]|uniref:Uncharacterized protein LOC18607162 isoform X3 n=1 Tax=Theobroma cacao TaxID=3641 RepID=A0AB32VW98_THECC|nr:PREDICTED: uncharacterized protein LOC18607162 isoform X3 [Theobroma cacao]